MKNLVKKYVRLMYALLMITKPSFSNSKLTEHVFFLMKPFLDIAK